MGVLGSEDCEPIAKPLLFLDEDVEVRALQFGDMGFMDKRAGKEFTVRE